PEMYTLSLHDALPILRIEKKGNSLVFDFTGCADQTKGPANIRPTIVRAACCYLLTCLVDPALAINYGLAKVVDIKVREGSVVNPDRKSTRLNSSHDQI